MSSTKDQLESLASADQARFDEGSELGAYIVNKSNSVNPQSVQLGSDLLLVLGAAFKELEGGDVETSSASLVLGALIGGLIEMGYESPAQSSEFIARPPAPLELIKGPVAARELYRAIGKARQIEVAAVGALDHINNKEALAPEGFLFSVTGWGNGSYVGKFYDGGMRGTDECGIANEESLTQEEAREAFLASKIVVSKTRLLAVAVDGQTARTFDPAVDALSYVSTSEQ